MKNLIKTYTLAVIFLITASFTEHTNYIFIGTYGVSENDPSQIRLTLNENHTFTYQDFSNPKKKINVNGNWDLKGQTVILKNYTSEYSFHNKWKFFKDGQVAKSRKGMTFFTLSKL